MAVTKAKYRRFYGTAAEMADTPTGWAYKNMDFYFATDTNGFYVYYNSAWILLN